MTTKSLDARDAAADESTTRLMSYDVSREVTDAEIDALAGATLNSCTATDEFGRCIEADC